MRSARKTASVSRRGSTSTAATPCAYPSDAATGRGDGAARLACHPRRPLRPARPTHRRRQPARVRPGQGAIWKLVSHLSLNHLSLASEKPGDAAAALREMLHLYLLDNIEDFEQKRRWIEGVRDISSSRIAARVGTAVNGVCQGVEVRVELDDEYFDFRTGFLFSSVLERFYAAWVNINSFLGQ